MTKFFAGSNRSRIYIYSLIAFSIVFFSMYFKIQFDINDAKKKNVAANNEYEQLVNENNRLRSFLEDADNPEKIEEFAREYRNYSYYDENVYYDVTPGY